jgi:hypothetical protein
LVVAGACVCAGPWRRELAGRWGGAALADSARWARAAGQGERTGWVAVAGVGPHGRPRPLFFFFETKFEIHFGASEIIGKIQIRYRWIRYEKYFNIRLNLEQNIKFIKPKFDIHVYVAILPF